jgi:hypothetical protein
MHQKTFKYALDMLLFFLKNMQKYALTQNICIYNFFFNFFLYILINNN